MSAIDTEAWVAPLAYAMCNKLDGKCFCQGSKSPCRHIQSMANAAIAHAEKAEAEREAALRLLADWPGPALSGRAFTTVATTVLAARPPCDPADPCPVVQDLASENRTLDGLLAEAKERAKDAEARAERMRAAIIGILPFVPMGFAATSRPSAADNKNARLAAALADIRAALDEREASDA